ncbi:hypothetical protein XENTR_v10010670 [Xenopus tropicalis]|nr:hypothetical protein XENTR_v10010670 [Xenopus tropicalis]
MDQKWAKDLWKAPVTEMPRANKSVQIDYPVDGFLALARSESKTLETANLNVRKRPYEEVHMGEHPNLENLPQSAKRRCYSLEMSAPHVNSGFIYSECQPAPTLPTQTSIHGALQIQAAQPSVNQVAYQLPAPQLQGHVYPTPPRLDYSSSYLWPRLPQSGMCQNAQPPAATKDLSAGDFASPPGDNFADFSADFH